MKKIRPTHKYTYLTFFIIFISLSVLLWCIMGTKPWLFNGDYLKERFGIEITYISISLFLCTLGALIYRAKVYYMVNDEMIVRHGKDLKEYRFIDIVYVDEGYTSHHDEILMYLNTNKWVTLTKDTKGELLMMIKKYAKLLDEDKLNFKYPDALRQKEKIK